MSAGFRGVRGMAGMGMYLAATYLLNMPFCHIVKYGKTHTADSISDTIRFNDAILAGAGFFAKK